MNSIAPIVHLAGQNVSRARVEKMPVAAQDAALQASTPVSSICGEFSYVTCSSEPCAEAERHLSYAALPPRPTSTSAALIACDSSIKLFTISSKHSNLRSHSPLTFTTMYCRVASLRGSPSSHRVSAKSPGLTETRPSPPDTVTTIGSQAHSLLATVSRVTSRTRTIRIVSI
jgi:hypothetical protein